jgi:hypothetical protein
MKRALAIAALLLLPRTADATQFRYPSTCHSGCMIVTAYRDVGGVKDWNCGSVVYSGHKGTDFGIIGRFTAMHEGRDINAAADGEVTYAHDGEYDRCTTGSCAGGSGFGNWVKLKHADGKETIYGHMKKGTVAVSVGQKVTCGQKLGQVGSSGYSTGPHLHFEPRVGGVSDDPFGKGACSGPEIFWVDQGAYKGLPAQTCEAIAPPPPPPNQVPKGSFDSADCEHIRGWAQDPDDPGKALDVHLYFDGEAGSGAKGLPIKANLSRPDLCAPLGSCEHAFDVPVPAELVDGKPHTIFAYAIDLTGGTNPKLDGGPKTVTCTSQPTSEPTLDDAGTTIEDAGGTATRADAATEAEAEAGDLQGSCGCRMTPAHGDHALGLALGLFLLTTRRRAARR